jgi:hypothetical protein
MTTSKKRKTKPRGSRRPGDGQTKIRVVTTANPRRAGTVQHARYAAVVRADGKTVDEYLARGGDRAALRYAAAQGHVKL